MILRNSSWLGLVSCSAFLGACVAQDGSLQVGSDDLGNASNAIVDGARASGYPEAVIVDASSRADGVACSGVVIAPSVVLSAGHCIDGYSSFGIYAPYASGQRVSGSRGITYDWHTTGSTANPRLHDIGLIFTSKPIRLASYPTLASSPLADGANVVNVGRKNNGVRSNSHLFAGQAVPVRTGATEGVPYYYIAPPVIETGDSGGPDFVEGTHVVAAVNSAVQSRGELLTRVDLVLDWINAQVAESGDLER